VDNSPSVVLGNQVVLDLAYREFVMAKDALHISVLVSVSSMQDITMFCMLTLFGPG
jgi:hypothetical protein